MTLSTEDEGLEIEKERGVSGYEQAKGRQWPRYLAHAILIIASLIAFLPFFWGLMTSLKPESQIFATIYQIIPAHPTLENYVFVWVNQPLDRWVMNSLVLSVAIVFLTLLLDTLAGYALAKGRFRGKGLLFTLVIGTLVIPPQVLLVPLYLEVNAINWGGTYWAIIVLFIANPFGTFFMRQFFLTIPDSLMEAARIDGCNTLEIYTRIMLPMAKPALSSLTVFTFIFAWSAFLWPLIIINDHAMFPLQVGIALLTGPYTNQWGQLLAASIMAAVPVITAYLLAQRTFMEGIALTGNKGA
ncbi:MAG: carbohydrate ABC transporter permease [Haloarculaceae archaeon]